MRRYIVEYINTLSDRRRERVSRILEDSRLARSELDRAAELLSESNALSPIFLSRIVPDSEVGSLSVRENIRSVTRAMEEMYDISNLIAGLINTHTKILVSETRAIEAEIASMEKMVSNFAFLLADPEAYNFSYLEMFEDERFRDNQIQTFTDRSGVEFEAEDQANVSILDSTLILPNEFSIRYGLMPIKIDSNVSAYSILETDLNRSVRQSGSEGWRMTVASAGAINSSLEGANGIKGAQIELEFRLEQPSACSALRLRPFADIPNEVLRVTLFADEEGEGIDILSSPRTLTRSLMLHFPVQSVLRFRVLLNQPTFKYVDSQGDTNQRVHRMALQEATQSDNRIRSRFSRIQRKVQEKIASPRGGFGMAALPGGSYADQRSGPMQHMSDIVRYSEDDIWKGGKSSAVIDLASRLTSGQFREAMEMSQNHLMRQGQKERPDEVLLERDWSLSSDKDIFRYHYNLGLQNVAIGLESPKYRGVYITRPLQSEGDIGQIRIKASDHNIERSDGRNSKYATSIEYSVTNNASLEREEDWVPILPIETVQVEGERLFVMEGGFARLRFPAASEGTITVYRNGHIISRGIDYVSVSAGRISKLRIDRSQFNPDDILTCDYYPAEDSTIIDFSRAGFDKPALAAAYDDTGAGEGFVSTGNMNEIVLSRVPYAESGSSAVVVRLDSGEVAQEVTALDDQDSVLSFIRQDSILRFSRAINEPFRVYYEYLENNVRLRVVLRCNDVDFATPNVDYVHVKAKTRFANTQNLVWE